MPIKFLKKKKKENKNEVLLANFKQAGNGDTVQINDRILDSDFLTFV